MIQSDVNEAKEEYEQTQQQIRKFKNLQYAAGSWNCKRRIIVKIEHLEKGSNPRFVVLPILKEQHQIYMMVCIAQEVKWRIESKSNS